MNLYKNLFGVCTLSLVLGVWAEPVMAARSSVSIMSPRSAIKIDKDYSYGYTYLAGDALDVYETPNRKIGWTVNYEYLDHYMLRPVSVAYVNYIPQVVRTCISNFTSNLREVNNTVNNLLVARPLDSGISATRFTINSTIGILGCIDVASYMGLEQKEMSLSTVMGKWGIGQGAYVQIPFLGGVTYRELIGNTIDTMYFPYTYFPLWADVIFWGVSAVDSRSKLLEQDEVLSNSFVPYIQARDFYLMYEEGLVTEQDVAGTANTSEQDENLDEFMDEIND